MEQNLRRNRQAISYTTQSEKIDQEHRHRAQFMATFWNQPDKVADIDAESLALIKQQMKGTTAKDLEHALIDLGVDWYARKLEDDHQNLQGFLSDREIQNEVLSFRDKSLEGFDRKKPESLQNEATPQQKKDAFTQRYDRIATAQKTIGTHSTESRKNIAAHQQLEPQDRDALIRARTEALRQEGKLAEQIAHTSKAKPTIQTVNPPAEKAIPTARTISSADIEHDEVNTQPYRNKPAPPSTKPDKQACANFRRGPETQPTRSGIDAQEMKQALQKIKQANHDEQKEIESEAVSTSTPTLGGKNEDD